MDTWMFKISLKKNHESGLISYIVSWNSKDESYGIIKLLSIIIPIFMQQIKLNFYQKTKVHKKLFLFKTIILSCEEVDRSKKKKTFKLKPNAIKVKLFFFFFEKKKSSC